MSMVIIAGHIDVSVGVAHSACSPPSRARSRFTGIRSGWRGSPPSWPEDRQSRRSNGVLVAYGAPSPRHRGDPWAWLSILKGRAHQLDLGRAWITNLPPGFLLAQFRLFGISCPGLVRRRPQPCWPRCGCAIPRWADRSTRFGGQSGRRNAPPASRPGPDRRVSSSRCTAFLRRDRGHPVRQPATGHPVEPFPPNLELKR